MMQDKISVIVPAYNLENYIEKTISSICSQTYRNLEIIVVDDGSQDNTPGILDQLEQMDNRIKVIHQSNTGVTKARFNGIRQATGEWIGFVDGDDYIEPEMYERLMNNAVKYNADISHCGYQMVFPSRVDYYHNTGEIKECDNYQGVKLLLEGSKIEPGLWNKLFHKSLLPNLYGGEVEDSGIKINEDLLMNFYLFEAATKSVYEDFCPYHYMIRKGSAATAKKPQHYTDSLQVLRNIHENVKDKAELSSIIQSRYIYLLINASMQTDFMEISEDAHKELKQYCENGLRINRKKLKWMAIMVAYFRPIYRMIRRIYEGITKVNRKYDVE